MINIDKNLKELALIFKNNQSTLYIVGGYVRNYFFNEINYDIDICSNLTINEVVEILKNTCFEVIVTNKTFGTAKIICNNKTYEYTTFRKDYYLNSGKHSPYKVEFINDIKTDANRRDFTINAIYYNINDKKYIDFFNGIEDAKNGILRALPPINETLKYDGDRILRLVKFAICYNLALEQETLQTAILYSKNVNGLSSNHIQKFLNYINNLPQDKKLIAKELLNKLNLPLLSSEIKG